MDRRLKIRHIHCFVEASKNHHIVDVALKLNLTQAAVSKTLSELDDIVGEPLLKRNRSGLKLTKAGETFLTYACGGLNSLNKGLEAVKLSNTLLARQVELRIGMLPAVAARFMPLAILQFFSMPHSPIKLSLSTGYNFELLKKLHNGQIDIAIARVGSELDMKELEFAKLYSEPMVMVVRGSHPILNIPSQDRSQYISKYPFLLPPYSTRIRPIIERVLIDLKITNLVNVIETVSNTFGRSFIPKSDAVWIISSGVVEDLLEFGSLKLVFPVFSDTSEPVGLLRRTDQELDIVASVICKILLDNTKSLRE